MKFEDHVRHFFEVFPNLDTPENRKIVEEVNLRIDQFAHFPNWNTLEIHRRYLHHEEGVEYFRLAYGEVGELAARLHIQDDTDHIPQCVDYYTGHVTSLGFKRD